MGALSPDRDPSPTFARLAAGPCPPFDELLLALSAELGAVDRAASLDALDDHARRLFGARRLGPSGRVERLASVLDGQPCFRAVDGRADPSAFLLDHVIGTRRGHPALLAVTGHELARRAGIDANIYSSPCGWFLGCGRERPALIAVGGAGLEMPRPAVRRHCSHEVAFTVVCGLEHSLTARGEADAAAHMAALRAHLPVSPLPGRPGRHAADDGPARRFS